MATTTLYAEFDIDKGSTLRASYPAAVDALEATVHRPPEFFADMMLPEGVHNREEDYTVFFIHEPESVQYCLSVVKTQHDANVRRGARVKAVAISSSYQFCYAFKPLVVMAVDKLFALRLDAPEAATTQILQGLFDAINRVDVSGVTCLQRSPVEVRLLKRSMSAKPLSGDIRTSDESLVFKTQAQWDGASVPLQIKLCSTHDQHEEGLLLDLIAKFGAETMTLYNAVLTGARIIMLGYTLPAGEVCNYVLSMSALLCPPLVGILYRQFPYANLTDLAFLQVPGFIAGVTNPMFKGKKEWWDVLCDLSSGDIVTNLPTEKDDADASDHDFILEVMDGIAAGFSEEWVRCMFEDYTRLNITDIVTGEAHFMDRDAQGRRTAINNRRITKWARTENYERFQAARAAMAPTTPAFDARARGVDLRRHVQVLLHERVLEDALVERMYADFVSFLHTEAELKELLSHLPRARGGLHVIAQGLFHASFSVQYNTIILLKRCEAFPATATAVTSLNPFVAMTYTRLHRCLVQPTA
ncbi:hypothetical protein SPRG_06256 [Saprolegnia parasitica CBS 223.65]|uniref:UDENN domain-containing protein n=1 Tax=Saprolegnia parasitica (strain CBS 223.65) TaxID=695850 RepID=A0A067CN53_SAPPC|nr:hypothetical protein SPRG_06256 [Saprolegnia parasitica CBS 223.65]KDO28207.1 hypothetical protein SPRG_06256 [Saprolegnia parasitica CBS 223.65]|eukprot:XP_012201032.1 hypothetical protein SPRG_06256 [Saprolegnia parasitica CBS 223.65]